MNLFFRINEKMRFGVRNKINRRRLKKKQICLLADNCNGSLILHDLGLQFNSPFVNLWLYPDDYIKYLKDIKHYMDCKLVFEKMDGISYPVAKLDDIRIFFMHYKTEEQAKTDWERRTKRIDLNDIWILMTEVNGCTMDMMKQFDELPYKHKVIFTHLKYPEIASSFYIKGFEKNNECGQLFRFIPHQFFGKRYYDRFDYVKWFNGSAG